MEVERGPPLGEKLVEVASEDPSNSEVLAGASGTEGAPLGSTGACRGVSGGAYLRKECWSVGAPLVLEIISTRVKSSLPAFLPF